MPPHADFVTLRLPLAPRALAWSPDSLFLAVGALDGGVSAWDIDGNCIWRHDAKFNSVRDIAWSPDDNLIASVHNVARLNVRRAFTGELFADVDLRNWSLNVGFSGDSTQVLFDSGRPGVGIYDLATGTFSYGEQNLSTPLDHHWKAHGTRVLLDSNVLVTATGGSIQFARDGEVFESIAASGSGLECVALSPDGCYAAFGYHDATIQLHNIAPITGARRGAARRTVLAYATKQLETIGYTADESAAKPPSETLGAAERAARVRDMETLPFALVQLHRMRIYPPLSIVRDVLDLVRGAEPDSSLRRLVDANGIRSFVALHWPPHARVGLASLLLHKVPFEEWEPPLHVKPDELRYEMTSALLRSHRGVAASPTVPSEAVAEAAACVDDRLLTLLEIIGPAAVARDPALPLRLLPRLPQIRPLHVSQRQRLGVRTPPGSAGRASGSGAGGERGGVDLSGDLRALLPTQLVLPPAVLRYRHARGELLYRAKLGQEPPRMRPTVIVLDVSAATVGAIEAITRLAAHVTARTLIQRGIRAILVTSGGQELVRVLDRGDDLVDIWTHRTNHAAVAARTLKIASATREYLRGDALDPLILVLSHPWFGSEEDIPNIAGLRGLFVQYPQHHARPVLAGRCERWETLTVGDAGNVSKSLGSLIG